MATFQALVAAVVQGITFVLPVGYSAHLFALDTFLGWKQPEVLWGMFCLANSLALFIYFRHDWASILSSFLRVCLTFSRPSSVDERLFFFLTIVQIPLVGTFLYFEDQIKALIQISPLIVGGALILFSFPIFLGEAMNRRSKSMLNWNWLDSLIVGLFQLMILIPGAGRQAGVLGAALLRNYDREAAVKFSVLSLTPLILTMGIVSIQDLSFSNAEPAANTTWLTLGISTFVCFFATLLAVNSLHKNAVKKGLRAYGVYRLVLGFALIGWHFFA